MIFNHSYKNLINEITDLREFVLIEFKDEIAEHSKRIGHAK